MPARKSRTVRKGTVPVSAENDAEAPMPLPPSASAPRIPWWRHLLRPLASRKNRVALVTLIVAFAAEWGWQVSEELLLTIFGLGASLILGIAHEDNGAKRNQ